VAVNLSVRARAARLSAMTCSAESLPFSGGIVGKMVDKDEGMVTHLGKKLLDCGGTVLTNMNKQVCPSPSSPVLVNTCHYA
jgi:hypothetical protein